MSNITNINPKLNQKKGVVMSVNTTNNQTLRGNHVC